MNNLFDKLFDMVWGYIRAGSWKALPFLIAIIAFHIYALVGTIIPYLQAQVQGVVVLEPAGLVALEAIENREQLYQIDGSAMRDTGYGSSWVIDYGIGGQTETSRSYYGLLRVANHAIIVSSSDPIDENHTRYQGRLSTYIQPEVLEGIQARFGDTEEILPFYLHGYRQTFDQGMTFVIVVETVLILATTWAVWRFIAVSILHRPLSSNG